MTRLLHVSDTHFGTEQPAVVEALVRLAQAARPELVVLSGDLTQRARRRQFDAARDFLGRLGAPVLAVPGNHDVPLFNVVARAFAPYAGWRRVMGRSLAPQHESAALLVLGVKTTRRWRHVNGEISRGQIAGVARRLQSAHPGQLRIVVLHQPAAAARPEDERHRPRGIEAAVAAWSAAGADLILGGHIHLPYVRELADGPRPVWAVQAGTAVSTRIRDGIPNSVNLLHWQPLERPRRCRVERWDHDAAAGAFTLREVSELVPARAGVHG